MKSVVEAVSICGTLTQIFEVPASSQFSISYDKPVESSASTKRRSAPAAFTFVKSILDEVSCTKTGKSVKFSAEAALFRVIFLRLSQFESQIVEEMLHQSLATET